jgi:multisubunit Na+/H+ antiporter MnhE subunit
MKREIRKNIIALVVMYLLHLIIANWSVIKHVILGSYQGGFIFFDYRLLIMCFSVFLVLQITQFASKEKK